VTQTESYGTRFLMVSPDRACCLSQAGTTYQALYSGGIVDGLRRNPNMICPLDNPKTRIEPNGILIPVRDENWFHEACKPRTNILTKHQRHPSTFSPKTANFWVYSPRLTAEKRLSACFCFPTATPDSLQLQRLLHAISSHRNPPP